MAKNLAKIVPKFSQKELSWIGFLMIDGGRYSGGDYPNPAEVMFLCARTTYQRALKERSYTHEWEKSLKSLIKKLRRYLDEKKPSKATTTSKQR